MRENRATARRLAVWFCLNLIIFVACYLNYRLQLKHRYLYKTLNVGLCFSRAAAMVINFNLLLVWLPMCKYSLTRLACLATGSLRVQRQRLMKSNKQIKTLGSDMGTPERQTISSESSQLARLAAKLSSSLNEAVKRIQRAINLAKISSINSFLIAVDHCKYLHTICATTITIASVVHTAAHLANVINFSKNFDPLLSNLNMAEYRGQNPLQLLISVPGITGLLMIMILILMSLSSVDIIRNSSYDLFQIFHRLSVVFVLLLFLHPFSHVLKEQSNVERHHPELCYDRMIIVLNNTTVSQLPEALDGRTRAVVATPSTSQRLQAAATLAQTTTTTLSYLNILNTTAKHRALRSFGDTLPAESEETQLNVVRSKLDAGRELGEHQGQFNLSTSRSANNHVDGETSTLDLNHMANSGITNVQNNTAKANATVSVRLTRKQPTSPEVPHSNIDQLNRSSLAFSRHQHQLQQQPCLDLKPLFVAQSSICWYVLSMGLSCYLLDLLLRRLRRSRSSIELLGARLDREGNLIELILSNNHKRFAHWLPGQFVYLNCPQIAAYEWHPFTISSMNNGTRQFTLHIKTGGDWTRKLRLKLEDMRWQQRQQQQQQQYVCFSSANISAAAPCQLKSENSMSSSSPNGNLLLACATQCNGGGSTSEIANHDNIVRVNPPLQETFLRLSCNNSLANGLDMKLPNLDCYNEKTGQLEIECTKLVRIRHDGNKLEDDLDRYEVRVELGKDDNCNGTAISHYNHNHNQDQHRLFSICRGTTTDGLMCPVQLPSSGSHGLNLFIDGPFHSPFERLLEQQVSVCIANGVGWTAFSSVFQCLISRRHLGAIQSRASHKMCPDKGNQKSSATTTTSTSTMANQDWWSQWRNFAVNTPIAVGNFRKISDTKLHLMVIVTTIEQLKPFYHLAVDYFNQIRDECQIKTNDPSNPIREVTAYITRSTEDDSNVKEFCQQERLSVIGKNTIKVNEVFVIHFGKPTFDLYLGALGAIYLDSCRKISVYCCGSYQVKKTVQEVCQRLNKRNTTFREKQDGPIYSYHEENF